MMEEGACVLIEGIYLYEAIYLYDSVSFIYVSFFFYVYMDSLKSMPFI
jgi:hypothetical protein